VTRRIALVVVAVAGIAVGVEHLAAAPVPKHLMPKDPPFSYPATVGCTWVYHFPGAQEETIAVAGVEEKDGAKLITTEYVRAGNRAHHMTQSVSAAGVFLVAEGGRTYPKPWCIFKLPHKEGDTWKTEGHGGDMKSGPMEKVKIPAGEILAARVDWDLGGRNVSYWYADGIGLVKMEGGANKGLKSFTRGKE
jgi:hypothetical protein